MDYTGACHEDWPESARRSSSVIRNTRYELERSKVNDARLLLIDGHALVHRAFHAVQQELHTSTGEPINAVFGFASMLLKALEDIKPTHVIMAMDRPVPTFRHDAFEGYKATRPKAPPLLTQQFGRVREVAAALNIPIREQDGYEADDVLGTLASQADDIHLPTTILTGDLDALQLVSADVHVLTARRGIADISLYDVPAVVDRYMLQPHQLPDYKGLVGDNSDNIPGVPGIGGKTASKLLVEYQTLEGIYEHLVDLAPRIRDSLVKNHDQAFRSRELATIVRTVPVTLDLDEGRFDDIDRAKLINLFRELEFRSLIPRVQQLLPTGSSVESSPVLSGEDQAMQLSIFGEDDRAPLSIQPQIHEQGHLVTSQLGLLDANVPTASETTTRIVRERPDLAALVADLRSSGVFSIDTETTGTDPLRAALVGMSFASNPGHAWYVPIAHAEGGQLPLGEVLDVLGDVLTSEEFKKVGHNLKYDYTVFAQHGLILRGVWFDTMIAAYLANTSSRNLSLSALAMSRLGIEMTPIESLIGKGKSQVTMDRVSISRTAAYAGADADVTLRLFSLLENDLKHGELTDLFHNVEMPLVTVLAEMERAGIALDVAVLADLSQEMMKIIGEREGSIYQQVGRRFNINSTQQLGQILFQELKLPSGRRTKTGFSTDSEVLEGLRGKHPMVDEILEYRQLIKLKNTYVDALPSLINPDTGRVHTDFNQTIAATGRLSSSNPNLQNIPIRGELGRRIRKAFVPGRPGHVLLAADYSQIELRVLASMSGDERLLDAFRSGLDIHRATASAVFSVPLEEVTSDQRRIAKVVNFGIIYGIGEGRLAYETGITRAEAKDFITNYNQTYAGVKSFMDNMKKHAALYGSVSTLLNRRRDIPEIHSQHPGIRAAAERAAINMPIQGTAADIIKLAMIRIHQDLVAKFPDSSMVLQVHDELVFDVPESDIAGVAELIRRDMETALPLEVPLEVEAKSGLDWYDMKPLQPSAA